MVIRWSDEALDNIDEIFDHIHPNDPAAAGEVLEQIFAAVRVLGNPKLHHIGRPGRWQGTRELVLSIPYIVPYRVTAEAIEILAVVHTSRQWPKAPPSR